jgi:hypothetical protein
LVILTVIQFIIFCFALSCLKTLEILNTQTINLPVILYGCVTWSVTLRAEHRLRVSENRVLRRIFGPKREEVAGGWRRLHNEELHNLYASPDIIRMIKSRRMRWAENTSSIREMLPKFLVGGY